MKMIRIVALVALGAAVVALAGVGLPERAGGASEPTAGIEVTGTGSVESVPDEASFSFGVQVRGSTAREVLSASSREMRRVLAALRASGVAGRDVQTTSVSMSPSYSQTDTIVGYWASNSVGVTLRDIRKVGAVLDALSAAGATEIDGPTWARSDRKALEARALREAVADARAKAEVLAAAGGVRLGRVTAITESRRPPETDYMRSALLAKDAPVPLRAGTEEVEATVKVTFAVD